MKYYFTVFFFFTLILAELPASDASAADGKVDEATIRNMVSEVVANLLNSSSEKTSEALVVEEPTVGDKLKSASDGIEDKIKEAWKELGEKATDLKQKATDVKESSQKQLEQAKESAQTKLDEAKEASKTKVDETKESSKSKLEQAKDYLGKKEQEAEDYLKSEQAQKDKANLLGKVKQAMKDYYEEDDKPAADTADAPAQANIEPVNAALYADKTLHSQASIWSAMLVLVCVLGIAGTITYCVREKDVITYSADSEMERLFKGGYYQSEETGRVY